MGYYDATECLWDFVRIGCPVLMSWYHGAHSLMARFVFFFSTACPTIKEDGKKVRSCTNINILTNFKSDLNIEHLKKSGDFGIHLHIWKRDSDSNIQ